MAESINDSAMESTSDFQKIKRLEALIFKLRMNRQQFGKLTGITSGHMSQIMSGNRRLTMETVKKIKEKLPNVNDTWLLTGSGTMILGEEDTERGRKDDCENLRSENQRLKDELIRVQSELVEAQRQIIRMQKKEMV